MAENVIYTYAPQMRDYLASKPVYAPYLMHFNEPNCNYLSFSTDDYGFRKTYDKKGNLISLADYNQFNPNDKAALIGNSTGFGVGSTSDQTSFASLLNKKTNLNWFNFCGRTFQSTQDILAYLFFSCFNEQIVMIISGINNFDLSYRWFNQKSIYMPPFYCQNEYNKRFQLYLKLNAIKKRLKNFLFFYKSGNKKYNETFFSDDIERSYYSNLDLSSLLTPKSINYALSTLKRDLSIVKNKTNNVYYLIQPITEWLNKKLSKEEIEIFKYLKYQRGPKWETISSFLIHYSDEYRRSIKQICLSLDIECFDLNELDDLKSDNWIFLDRYHLTDLGQSIVSDYIVNIIN